MASAPALATLNEELESLVTEREAIRKEHTGEVMPETARQRDAYIVGRVGELRILIEAEQQRKRDALMNDTARYLEDPNYQVPRAVNDDDQGRRTLMQAGWSFRGGVVYRQTTNKEVAFCNESVLFGSMPTDDPVAAAHFRTMRAAFQPEYKAAWLKWLRNRGNFGALSVSEQNALSEGTASEGGFTVPADFQAEVLARRADASVIRRLARVVQTSRDRVQWPAVTPHASSGSIYSSAFVGGMVGERPVNSDAGPSFQMFEIGIKKFEAYTRVSNDLINDSAADIMGFLSVDGGRNLGLVEDDKFINGVGTGLEPMGILNVGITTADVEGSTTDNISNSVSNAGSAPKIIALAYLVPAQYAEGASWLMARQTQGEIHALVDADSRPWWQPQNGAGGAAGAPLRLVDIPVYTTPFMPVDNTNANKVLLVGDFQNLIIADRTSLSVQIDTVNLIASDETQIFLRSRAGSGVWNTDAFRIGIV